MNDNNHHNKQVVVLDRERHISYFVTCLKKLPYQYSSLDTNRLTLVYFCVVSLDILGFFDDEDYVEFYQINVTAIINWIYSLQIIDEDGGGFKGGTHVSGGSSNNNYNHSHIAMTFVALCTLITLGDDLQNVNKESIKQSLEKLQLPNGSFQSTILKSESDLRFVYCACAISYILEDFCAIDIDKAKEYIESCMTYDNGSIALVPGQEGHGGSTFCGVASLILMNQSFISTNYKKEWIQWCVSRQIKGMQGRPNKYEDTCYSYWIGGTLHLLLSVDNEDDNNDILLDSNELDTFVLSCQTDLGGFSKFHGGTHPDILHSFYSLAWLSLNNTDLNTIDCKLGMCQKRIDHYFQLV